MADRGDSSEPPDDAVAAPATSVSAHHRRTLRRHPQSIPPPLPVLDRTQKTIKFLNGPILFTAPHGLEVYRGIPGVERSHLHGRERYVTQIVLRLARYCGRRLGGGRIGASAVIWNDAVIQQRDRSNLDPNYLVLDQFDSCPFHRALVRFRDRFDGVAPTLHVDIHGKNHRKREVHQMVDVGLMPMQRFFEADPDLHETLRSSLVGRLTPLMKNYAAFKRIKKTKNKKTMTNAVVGEEAEADDQKQQNLTVRVEGHPKLNGLTFGETVHTMSRQSVLLGTPAVQLELPPCVRHALATDRLFLAAFGDALVGTYEDVFFRGGTTTTATTTTRNKRRRRRQTSGASSETVQKRKRKRRQWSVEEVRWRLPVEAPKMVRVPWRTLLRTTRRVDKGFPQYYYEEGDEGSVEGRQREGGEGERGRDDD